MAKITIYAKGLKGAELDAMKKLVEEEACDGKPQAVQAIGAADPEADDEVVLVLGTPTVCADSKLEDNLKKAVSNGQRVIWVWPEGGGDSEPPVSAKKYCYSYLPWDADKLTAVVTGESVMYFETATGRTVKAPDTERNMCVEEDAKS